MARVKLTSKDKVISTTQNKGLDQVFGMFSHKKHGKTTVEDMDKAIAQRMRQKSSADR